MKRLLIVFHTQTGRTEALARAAYENALNIAAEAASEDAGGAEDGKVAADAILDVRLQRAFDTVLEDLLAADALLICSPENFGTMAGAVKDLFDRTFYPAEGLMLGRPYSVLIACGNDGSGAMRDIDRIATGYRWKKVHPGHIARKETTAADLALAGEIGGMLAAGIALGIF